MVARPTVSLTPWARRYGGSSTLLIVFTNENAAEDKRILGGARESFFRKARCTLLVSVEVGLAAPA